MDKLQRLDPTVSIWPPMLVTPAEEALPSLTGADWNALVERVEALEAICELFAGPTL